MKSKRKHDIVFALVPAHLVLREIAPNVARHHREMHDIDDNGSINVDWDAYYQGGLMGSCVVVTARDNGKLIGYSSYQVGPNARQKHVIEAYGDGLVIEPEYRGTLGRIFLNKCEEFLKAYGVSQTSYVIGSDRVGRLLERNGYGSQFKVWSKKI